MEKAWRGLNIQCSIFHAWLTPLIVQLESLQTTAEFIQFLKAVSTLRLSPTPSPLTPFVILSYLHSVSRLAELGTPLRKYTLYILYVEWLRVVNFINAGGGPVGIRCVHYIEQKGNWTVWSSISYQIILLWSSLQILSKRFGLALLSTRWCTIQYSINRRTVRLG